MTNNTSMISSDQVERAKLREDYLRTLAAMSNRPVQISLCENTKMEAKFKAYHPDGKKILVADAEIPMGGTAPSAILRCSDVISVVFQPS